MPQHNGTGDKLSKKRVEAKDQMAFFATDETFTMIGCPETATNRLYRTIDHRQVLAFFMYS
jgi:hypothetical protein